MYELFSFNFTMLEVYVSSQTVLFYLIIHIVLVFLDCQGPKNLKFENAFLNFLMKETCLLTEDVIKKFLWPIFFKLKEMLRIF